MLDLMPIEGNSGKAKTCTDTDDEILEYLDVTERRKRKKSSQEQYSEDNVFPARRLFRWHLNPLSKVGVKR